MNLLRSVSQFDDAMAAAHDMARKVDGSPLGIVGYGVAHLLDGDGKTKRLVPFANLITDAGDAYYAKMGTALVGTPNTAQPTKANGMKLGTASTAADKATIGAASLAASADYISGSNVAFDSAYPQTAAVGSNVGWNATYKTTWAAGTATNSTINSVVIVNDQATNATTSVANTYSRAVISTVNKTASDSLAITWNHKFLGA